MSFDEQASLSLILFVQDLRHCGFGVDGLRALCTGLAKTRHVEKLMVSNNNIGPSGGVLVR